MLSLRDIAGSDDEEPLEAALHEAAARHRLRRLGRDEAEEQALFWEPRGLPSAIAAAGRGVRLAAVKQLCAAHPELVPSRLITRGSGSNGRSGGPHDGPVGDGAELANLFTLNYPRVWHVPAQTIPRSYFLPMCFEQVGAAGENADREGGRDGRLALRPRVGSGNVDYSATPCLVRIRREVLDPLTEPCPAALTVTGPHGGAARALPLPLHRPATRVGSSALRDRGNSNSNNSRSSSNNNDANGYVGGKVGFVDFTREHRKVLARWPDQSAGGDGHSTKLKAVLRSIAIDTRKREQWNEHVKQFYQGAKGDSGEPQGAPANGAGARGVGGTATTALSSITGESLYWPARVSRVVAVFDGAALADSVEGLALLQRVATLEEVVAMALQSRVSLCADVVYCFDEVSEQHRLRIAPNVLYPGDLQPGRGGDPAGEARAPLSTTAAAAVLAAVRQHYKGGGGGGGSLVFPPALITALGAFVEATYRRVDPEEARVWQPRVRTGDDCPLLIPATFPDVISIANYSFTEAVRRTGEAAPAEVKARLNTGAISNSPLSLYEILAGPVCQTQSVVFLRPTEEMVAAAFYTALQDLVNRWLALRQALLGRLTAFEEELPTLYAYEEHVAIPTTRLVRLPTLTTSMRALRRRLVAVDRVPQAVARGGAPPIHTAVALPYLDTYESPFIAVRVRAEGEALPPEPNAPGNMNDAELRRAARLPRLQSSASSRPPSANTGAGQPTQPPRFELLGARGSALISRPVSPAVGTTPGEGLTHSTISTSGVHVAGPSIVRGDYRLSTPYSLEASERTAASQLGYSGVGEESAAAAADEADRAARRRHLPDTHPRGGWGRASGSQGRAEPSPAITPTPLRHAREVASHGPRPSMDGHADGAKPRDVLPEPYRELSPAAGRGMSTSGAVREAARRERATEAAIARQQRPASAPRAPLPVLRVEAPTPVADLPVAQGERRRSGRDERGGRAGLVRQPGGGAGGGGTPSQEVSFDEPWSVFSAGVAAGGAYRGRRSRSGVRARGGADTGEDSLLAPHGGSMGEEGGGAAGRAEPVPMYTPVLSTLLPFSVSLRTLSDGRTTTPLRPTSPSTRATGGLLREKTSPPRGASIDVTGFREAGGDEEEAGTLRPVARGTPAVGFAVGPAGQWGLRPVVSLAVDSASARAAHAHRSVSPSRRCCHSSQGGPTASAAGRELTRRGSPRDGRASVKGQRRPQAPTALSHDVLSHEQDHGSRSANTTTTTHPSQLEAYMHAHAPRAWAGDRGGDEGVKHSSLVDVSAPTSGVRGAVGRAPGPPPHQSRAATRATSPASNRRGSDGPCTAGALAAPAAPLSRSPSLSPSPTAPADASRARSASAPPAKRLVVVRRVVRRLKTSAHSCYGSDGVSTTHEQSRYSRRSASEPSDDGQARATRA